MKKKIGLILLLIAVTASMAFAEDGRSISFKFDRKDITTVTKVEEVATGIKIYYKGNTGTIIFSCTAVYNDGKKKTWTNKEHPTEKDKLYSFGTLITSASKIKSVEISAKMEEKTKTEIAKDVLENMGQANELGEYLSAYTKLGDALENVPDNVKKIKKFFDKAAGPLNAAVNAKLLYQYVRDYKSANAKQKGDIGEKVAKAYFDLISPVVNATPQGALINVSIQIGITCYKSMMASVAQHNFEIGKTSYIADIAPYSNDYIDENSPWYALAVWLYLDKMNPNTIFTKVSKLENVDPSGIYAEIALACYDEGAKVDQIYDVVSALVEIDRLNERKAQQLRDAEKREAQAKLKAENDKKKADAKKRADVAKAAAIKAKLDNQKIIQNYCKFGDAASVWKVIDTHPFANDLYRIWATSYPNPLLASKPKGKTDKEIIQERCKFGKPQAVWNVIAKHKNGNDLLKAWADSYYKGLRK